MTSNLVQWPWLLCLHRQFSESDLVVLSDGGNDVNPVEYDDEERTKTVRQGERQRDGEKKRVFTWPF